MIPAQPGGEQHSFLKADLMPLSFGNDKDWASSLWTSQGTGHQPHLPIQHSLQILTISITHGYLHLAYMYLLSLYTVYLLDCYHEGTVYSHESLGWELACQLCKGAARQ